MSKNQRLSTTITIGAALKASTKGTIGVLRTGLKAVGSEIRSVTDRQRELDRQRRVLVRAGESVEELDREYRELDQTLERLRRSQDRWERSVTASSKAGVRFGRMTGEIGSLMRATGATAAAAGASVFALANSTADLGDQTAKAADKLGIQIGALQELRYSAERSGVATGTFDTALQRFTRRLSDAASGSGPAVAAFEELGLSAEWLSQMSPDEALGAVADAMSKVKAQGDRVRIAFKLFDSEGVGMVNMLKDGSAGLRQLREDARATGYVLSDQAARDAEVFKDKLLDAELSMLGLKNTIGAALMPVVAVAMADFKGWIIENREAVGEFAARFAGGFRDALPRIGQAAMALSAAASVVGGMIAQTAELVGGFDNLGLILGATFAGKALLSVGMFAHSLWGVGAALFSLAGGLPAVAVGVKAIGAALFLNPIGATVTAIAAGAALLVANWDTVGPWFGAMWDGIKSAAGVAWEWLKRLFSWSPLGLVVANWGPLSDWFGGLWDGIVGGARDAFEWIEGKLSWIGGAAEGLGDLLGFGGDEEEPRQPDPPAIRDAASRYAARSAATSTTVNAPVSMVIYQQPGQDAEALAAEIERLTREHERSALYDIGGA